MNTSNSRRGVSLVEVIIVLAVILIIIGLLLPAVQRVRESAAQTVCRNNLKQIALAVLQYEVANKTLPPAGTGYGWCYCTYVPEPCLPDRHIVNQNGLSFLLSYLGQESLDASLDRTKAFSLAASPYGNLWPVAPDVENSNGFNPTQNGASFTPGDTDLAGNANLALMGRQLAIFRCPSEIGDPVIPADPSGNAPFNPKYGPGGSLTGAKTNYDFVAFVEGELSGCNSWKYWHNPTGGQHPYMFGQNSNCPIARVTDGMSNSFMLAETLFTWGIGQGSAWGYRSWMMSGVDPAEGINGPVPGQYGAVPQASPGSMHPGGCFFAMGDGSVRWLSQDAGSGVLYDLSTINDGTSPPID